VSFDLREVVSLNADGYHVAAAQLAINRKVEQRQVAYATLHLQLGPV